MGLVHQELSTSLTKTTDNPGTQSKDKPFIPIQSNAFPDFFILFQETPQ